MMLEKRSNIFVPEKSNEIMSYRSAKDNICTDSWAITLKVVSLVINHETETLPVTASNLVQSQLL